MRCHTGKQAPLAGFSSPRARGSSSHRPVGHACRLLLLAEPRRRRRADRNGRRGISGAHQSAGTSDPLRPHAARTGSLACVPSLVRPSSSTDAPRMAGWNARTPRNPLTRSRSYRQSRPPGSPNPPRFPILVTTTIAERNCGAKPRERRRALSSVGSHVVHRGGLGFASGLVFGLH
jgi:hypothetical protein